MNWIDAEFKRPADGQKIILENYLGLFWAIFTTELDGMVYIEGKKRDHEFWNNVERWIPYPNDD